MSISLIGPSNGTPVQTYTTAPAAYAARAVFVETTVPVTAVTFVKVAQAFSEMLTFLLMFDADTTVIGEAPVPANAVVVTATPATPLGESSVRPALLFGPNMMS